jgi:hypothetical protein
MCIPGWHYNPVKDITMYQPIRDANISFWKQVITGDRTDNILGIPGLGPKAADRIIDPCDGDWNRMHAAADETYSQHFGADGYRQMDETAKLIWILRKAGETYDGSRI